MKRILLVLLIFSACVYAENKPTRPIDEPDLQEFSKAVKEAELTDLFEGTGPFTAFVPTNAAIDKYGKSNWNELLKPQNRDKLTNIIIYHIAPGKYMAKNLKSSRLQTVNGKMLEVTVDGDEIKINNAKVVKKDLVGPNGVVHEIDTVLVP